MLRSELVGFNAKRYKLFRDLFNVAPSAIQSKKDEEVEQAAGDKKNSIAMPVNTETKVYPCLAKLYLSFAETFVCQEHKYHGIVVVFLHITCAKSPTGEP